jgi:hypothetical protein
LAFRNQGGNVVEYNHIHHAMQITIDGAYQISLLYSPDNRNANNA